MDILYDLIHPVISGITGHFIALPVKEWLIKMRTVKRDYLSDYLI